MKHKVCLTPNHLRAQKEAQTHNNLIKIHITTSHKVIQLGKKQQHLTISNTFLLTKNSNNLQLKPYT